ncbi:MAG: ClpXP protease specificity-enhancing factor [Gammaproteobacteria bacterium]|nr:MAG: ClpXP protease specificity-enhancing factor [Gammaproteobacteria bacterium]|tara:strand:- start:1113 stop:1490 length:378 start_codon:yes stop_codon:yes gene_type:complete
MAEQLIPKKPYFIRAMFDWISDNNYTPHILIDSSVDNVCVPNEFIENDRITLNISYSASNNLEINSNSISFDARFNGKSVNVNIPCEAVMNIFAKETGEGMVFSVENENREEIKKEKRSHLKLVE